MHEFPPPWWPLSNYGYAGVPVPLVAVTAAALLMSLRVTGSPYGCVARTALLFGLPPLAMLYLDHSRPRVFAPGRDFIVSVLVVSLWVICVQGVVRSVWIGKLKEQSSGPFINSVGVGAMIGIVTVFACRPTPHSAREAGFRTQCKNNLKQIGLALHNYHDIHQMFPTPVQQRFDRSWRVTLLPLMDQEALYARYNQDATWDHSSNLPLAEERVPPLDCPGRPVRVNEQNQFLTAYSAVTGPGAAFEDSKYIRMRDFTDGHGNTLFVTEACGKQIVWTEPKDVSTEGEVLQINAPGPQLHQSAGIASSYHLGGANALMADGSVRLIGQNIDREILERIVTRAGEPVWEETLETDF